MKKTLLALAGAALIAMAASSTAMALPINGSIGFNGTPTVSGGTSFSTSTSITSYTDTTVAGGSASGTYGAVTGGTVVTFSPFQYNTPVVPISPLWSFAFGGLTYSFDVKSMVSEFSNVTRTWNIAGTGIAHVTGFDDTTGTFTFTLTNSGAAFSFASTATASKVPESGSTALLVGLCLVGMGLVARKRSFLV
jgi:hypothetical protein